MLQCNCMRSKVVQEHSVAQEVCIGDTFPSWYPHHNIISQVKDESEDVIMY